MRQVVRGKQVQVIVVETGEDWSVDILHDGTLLSCSERGGKFRVVGGKKRSWKKGR